MSACVVLGGHGVVGSALVGLLAGDGDTVSVVDRRERPGGPVPGAVATFVADLDAVAAGTTPLGAPLAAVLAAADVVVVALPDASTAAVLPALSAAMADDALLVDTCSVKRHVTAVGAALGRRHVLSLDPMYTPTLPPTGQTVAAVVVAGGPPVAAMLERWRRWGAHVVLVDADEHDRATAGIQVITHAALVAAGLALAELDVGIEVLEALASPPHRVLLALLARVACGAPATYAAIQTEHPHAADARAALAHGLARLDGAARSEAAAVPDLLAELGAFLGTTAGDHARRCAVLFESFPDRPHHDSRPVRTTRSERTSA